MGSLWAHMDFDQNLECSICFDREALLPAPSADRGCSDSEAAKVFVSSVCKRFPQIPRGYVQSIVKQEFCPQTSGGLADSIAARYAVLCEATQARNEQKLCPLAMCTQNKIAPVSEDRNGEVQLP